MVETRPEHPLMPKARALVHECLEQFGQVVTHAQVESAATGIVNALPLSVRIAACDHRGWTFKQHGRCCFTCGGFMVDPGD